MDTGPSNHPSPETLQAYGRGELDDDAAKLVRKHLADCDDCRYQVTEITTDGSASSVVTPIGSTAANHATSDSSSSPRMSSTGAVDVTSDAANGRDETGLQPGTRVGYFGDYELLKVLGEGGMGIVYKARQLSLNRPVALKMIKASRFPSSEEVRRFQNEAEAVARLDHPNIVPIFEVGRFEDQHYFSMKLIAGESLDRRLKDYVADPRRAATLMVGMSEAILHAHQRGILHRDLKPANILVDREGQPHVSDFGLAKRIDGDSELTRSGALVGTPAYMAPEQASGSRGVVTTSTDVYGLGAILYAMLAGRAPFGGASVLDVLDQVRDRNPDSPRKLNSQVPHDLEVICLKCLEKDPRRRYTGADTLAEDLRHWLAGEPIAARSIGSAERAWLWVRRHPMASTLVSTSVLLLAATLTAALIISHNRELQRANLAIEESRGTLQRAYASEAAARREAESARQKTAEQREIAVTARDEARNALGLANHYLYLFRVSQASSAWQENEPARASALLEDCSPDERGWEWHYLNRQRYAALAELRNVIYSTVSARTSIATVVGGIAFSSDGAPLAITGQNGAWQLRETDLKRVARLSESKRQNVMIRASSVPWLSADGRCILFADHGRLETWEPSIPTPVLRINSPTAGLDLDKLVPSSDGRLIAGVRAGYAAYSNGPLWLWDEQRGWWQLIARGTDDIHTFCFTPDGGRIAVVRDSGISIWDVRAGREVLKLLGTNYAVGAVTFSPNGSRLAGAGHQNGSLPVWDTSTGHEVFKLKSPSLAHTGVSFSPDGRRIAAAGDDGVISIWDLARDGRVAPAPWTFRNRDAAHL